MPQYEWLLRWFFGRPPFGWSFLPTGGEIHDHKNSHEDRDDNEQNLEYSPHKFRDRNRRTLKIF